MVTEEHFLSPMWWKIVYERQNQTEFYWMRKENNVWGFLEKAYFTQDGGRDNNPLFVGKDTLFFYSSRLGGSICRIIRSGNQWYQPVRISLSVPVGKFLGKQFSIKKKGIIYAELWNNDASDADVYRWKPVNGQYRVSKKSVTT